METFKVESRNVREVYWSQYMTVISATIVSTLSGINFGWPSPSVPKLLSDEYPFPLNREDCSYIAVIAPMGNILGGPIYAYLVDIIGRKRTLLLIAVPQITSLILIYFSYLSPVILYVARFIGGIGEGANITIMAIYIGEIASPAIRGNLVSYVSLTLRTGVLTVNIVGSYMSIYNASLVYLALPLIFLATFSVMPESPYYLTMRQQPEQAKKALRFLRRRSNVDDEYDRISKDVARQTSESGTFKDLFTIRSNRKAFLICSVLRTIQQFSGISAFNLYTQLLFKEAGTSLDPKIASILYVAIQFLTTFVSSLVVDKAGRKPLLIFSCASCVVCLLTEAIFFTLRDHLGVDVSVARWLPLLGMIVFVIVFAIGLGNLVNVMLGEMFAQKMKAKALCLNNIYFAITMSTTTKFFQYLSDNVGLAIPFYAFAFNCLVGMFFCYFAVPETKNRTLEEIQQELKKGRRKSEH